MPSLAVTGLPSTSESGKRTRGEKVSGTIALVSGIILALGIVLAATQRYSGMSPIMAQVVSGFSGFSIPVFTISLFAYLMTRYDRKKLASSSVQNSTTPTTTPVQNSTTPTTPPVQPASSRGQKIGSLPDDSPHHISPQVKTGEASAQAAERRRKENQTQSTNWMLYDQILPNLLNSPVNNKIVICPCKNKETISSADFNNKCVVLASGPNWEPSIAILHNNEILEFTKGEHGEALAQVWKNGNSTTIENPTRTHDQIEPFVDYVRNF